MSTDQPAGTSWVGIGLALIAVGAVLAFTFTGEVLGIDVDVAGWLLMAAGVVALVAAATRRRRR